MRVFTVPSNPKFRLPENPGLESALENFKPPPHTRHRATATGSPIESSIEGLYIEAEDVMLQLTNLLRAAGLKAHGRDGFWNRNKRLSDYNCYIPPKQTFVHRRCGKILTRFCSVMAISQSWKRTPIHSDQRRKGSRSWRGNRSRQKNQKIGATKPKRMEREVDDNLAERGYAIIRRKNNESPPEELFTELANHIGEKQFKR
jgi:hypothetical protein